MSPMPSARRCAPFLAAVFATLALTASAQADSFTTTTLPPQNVTTTSATFQAQVTCNPGTVCWGYYHWHQSGSNTWYNGPELSHPCSGSTACSFSQTLNQSGLNTGATYGYYLCTADNSWSFVCHGVNGTNAQQDFVATTTTVTSPPANVTAPSVSGTAKQGYTLTATNGSWTNSPTSYTYQWQDCDTTGANCGAISGATGPSYVLGAGDVGHTVVVQETAANSAGAGAPAGSAPTAAVVANTITQGGGSLTFNGTFDTGLTPWTTGGGSAQCANYGTPSKYPRYRGNFYLTNSPVGQGSSAAQITLPADPSPSTYPLEACDLVTATQPNTLGSDQYYGMMVYVPLGWRIANNAFYGIEFAEYHFQNVYGAPIAFQLHPDHVTVALEMGGCNNYTTASPGCQYRSQADSSWCPASSTVHCLPKYYAIPPGALTQGAWNEIVMHVHWAADSTGQFQTWYRTAGSPTWTQSSSMSGAPTVQWDNTVGCCGSKYVDETEAYTAALSAPTSIWLDNDISGTGFGAVAGAMP